VPEGYDVAVKCGNCDFRGNVRVDKGLPRENAEKLACPMCGMSKLTLWK
jgi:transcription elongation factor Elf1